MQAAPEPGLTVFAGAHLRATLFDPGRARLAVSFDHLERGRRGFSGAAPSRAFARRGFAQLVVQSAANDWYLNADLAPLMRALAPVCAGYDGTTGIGFSMGGFAALKLSAVLRLRQVLLVSAQVTPFAERAPFDGRYRRFAGGMLPALDLRAQDIAPELQGLALFDPLNRSKDRDHARAIAALAPGVRAVALPFGGHPATGLIRRAGLWGHLQRLVAEDRLTPAAMLGLRHKARGGSLDYAHRLADALEGRAARRS